MHRDDNVRQPSIRNTYERPRPSAHPRTDSHRSPVARPARPIPAAARRRAQTPYPAAMSAPHARAASRSAATALIALMLVAAVGFAAWFSLQASQGALPLADAAAKSGTGAAESTPKAEWKQGAMPFLYQTDPAWSSVRYAENNFGESGCGPTCMAMVYIALTGATDKDPAAMAALATQGGYAGPDGTAWLFMSEGASSLGLAATEVPADEQSMRRELAAGRPIIASMGPGDFTETGHFIVITDIDRTSKLVIRDPNSPERSAVSWDFDTVISQCRALWSYSLV